MIPYSYGLTWLPLALYLINAFFIAISANCVSYLLHISNTEFCKFLYLTGLRTSARCPNCIFLCQHVIGRLQPPLGMISPRVYRMKYFSLVLPYLWALCEFYTLIYESHIVPTDNNQKNLQKLLSTIMNEDEQSSHLDLHTPSPIP